MHFKLLSLAAFASCALAAPTSNSAHDFAELVPRDNNAVVTNQYGLRWYNSDLTSGNNGQSNPNSYTCYSGMAKTLPGESAWMNFNAMWALQVKYNLGPSPGINDSQQVITWIKNSIISVSQVSKVDARVILAMIILESTGNPNVKCTTSPGGVPNCGLMQSYNPPDKSYNGTQASILQMIRDGTQGTPSGPGMVQLINDGPGTPELSGGNIYKSLREYNSGSVNITNVSDGLGANPAYVSDILNYLLGWNGYGTAPSKCGFPNNKPQPSTTSTTSTSTKTSPTPTATQPAPAPTASGTTARCYQWYTVQSNDNCYTIEQAYGISFSYFQSLNTEINSGCTNLYLNYAYCVNGVAGATAPATTTVTTTTSVTTVTATPTTTAAVANKLASSPNKTVTTSATRPTATAASVKVAAQGQI